MTYQKPKGTEDWFGGRIARLAYIEAKAREVAARFRAQEIRTPIFESTELFKRGVGDSSDIVRKEMFSLEDNGGRSLTLKPEGTAGVVRAYIENGMANEPQPVKLFYISPIFRAERPQKGRLRQHHQFGVEIFGSCDAAADAEAISLAWLLLQELGVRNVELRLNSLGCPDCREQYHAALIGYLRSHESNLCGDCHERLAINPLRVLDCKNEPCKAIVADAPKTTDYLDEGCKAHFASLQSHLSAMGIPFSIDPLIVRGLDYYNRTVFELVSTDLGGQTALGGGGRYDGLAELLGGAPAGAIGFGMGLERLMIVMESQGLFTDIEPMVDIYIGALRQDHGAYAAGIISELRKNGFSTEVGLIPRSVKAQFKYADKINARFACLVGDDELHGGKIHLKDMRDGTERLLTRDELITGFKKLKGV